jgi:hypothetical protein
LRKNDVFLIPAMLKAAVPFLEVEKEFLKATIKPGKLLIL